MAANFHEAATRTFDDAQALHTVGRLGGADHLFGLAAECALKAVLRGPGVGLITSDPPQAPFRQHINHLWHEYHVASTGLPTSVPTLGANPFSSWSVTDRYEQNSTFTPVRVATHRDGAREAMAVLEAATIAGLTQ